ncbi:putative ABC multidrug transporter [Xylaria bambusicola]|uniref:putative ABC multidrug transporter n=1 Tax=Xylaria bambusicola TaxID=326684 RepID=UPI002007D79A|nr:putative ABC multidrug transporter [Xylaria bambusicola]KAI0517535.1 putative ABC multidrug transporter [Xylaria bambusicola]
MSSTDASDTEKIPLPGESRVGEGYLSGLTLTFDDLAIEVEGVSESYVSTVSSVVTGLLSSFKKNKNHKRHILQGVTGQVRPGEMLLVLGRPGSGCTSLLKVLANMRQEFSHVTGKMSYGNIDHQAAHRFRHQIVMNTEDDQHFPTLLVSDVMKFAVSTKVAKKNLESTTSKIEHIENKTTAILDSLGISHVMETAVGDEFIRGVSGGERKRVSVAEVMATEALVQCWDNSTRGLDASNAFDFARVLRRVTDEQNKTMIATLYQAGNGIYNQFDKVLVLAEGREIYYGPASEAKSYFEKLGFRCPPSGNVADFLTSVTVPTEREILPGFESTAPKTTEDFERAYKSSVTYESMKKSMVTDTQLLATEVDRLDKIRMDEKNRTFHFLSRDHSVYQVSLARQILACTARQLQMIWGDRWSNSLKLASNIIIALISGSLFYNLAPTSAATFDRAGALFWPIIYLGLNCLSETTASFMGRPIFSRHKLFGFARPAAQAIACTLADIPFTIVGVSIFEIIYYFLAGFTLDAGKFFTQWFIYIVFTLCLLSFYRMIGAWNSHFGVASQIAGWCTMVIMVYAGYLIPVPKMHPWFRWIAYIDPVQYTFGALMGSETGGLTLECVEPEFIPYGAEYQDIYRGCSAPGSTPGQSTYSGAEFLKAQYGDFTQHVWRNVGIVIAFWVFFAIMAALGFELNLQRGGGSQILYAKRAYLKSLSEKQDMEKGMIKETSGDPTDSSEEEEQTKNGTVFTFRDINYFVHAGGSEKQLLQNVSGYVTPGKLVALMGSSGAGKTTLMDVLAQRKDFGTVKGSILINGKPQGISFQRDTGYCEQNDVHEVTATVREALLFSARLRQPHHVPDAEKVAYVEYIMALLELFPLQHAIIGSPNSGLSIEQRKRLTIATELVAKPSLLFLDEPTSGLDGQSAYEICRFMKKLAAAGQTIICTIHQPSGVLFETFDVLLLLAKGGRTTYFGETGKNSSTVLDYFARHGVPCPVDANPAEHIVDVVQGRFGTEIDWPAEWEASEERQKSLETLSVLEQVQGHIHNGTSQEEEKSFAAPIPYQISQVTRRQLISLWRNPDYVWNKLGLHITNGLFAGFTFWKIGNGSFDVQLRLMSVFNFLFVAPGCINQLQPLFIRNRDIFETREKKSKTYSWIAFISAQLLSEVFILIVCATVYFVSWYFTSGFPVKASVSGQVYLQMILYEFLYTSIGQAIAAYSPNAYFAALANPIFVGSLIQFCGILVPYSRITPFWRYWFYYLNPFTYLVGGLLVPVVWDTEVVCKAGELTTIPLPPDTTCGEYMSDFLSQNAGYITDAGNTTTCSYCPYSTGADFLRTLNFEERYYGWRDVGITALFCISSYALVFLMMRLRTKATKTAN